jgi:hypothetical protein
VEHPLDFFEIGSSDLFFPLGPLLLGRQDHGPRGQGENLVERRLISHERPLDQSFPRLSQGSKIDLQEAGDSVIIIEAQSMAVGDSDQKKVEKDFHGREISDKSSCDETMIDPAEGAFDLSEPFGKENSFGLHGHHPLGWMILFCSRGIDFSI